MKKKVLLITTGIFILNTTGCSTPKHKVVGIPSTISTYELGQEPVKVEFADKGWQWNRNMVTENQDRLDHQRRMKLQEYQAEEIEFAKKRGFLFEAPQTGRTSPSNQRGWITPGLGANTGGNGNARTPQYSTPQQRRGGNGTARTPVYR